MLSYQIVRKLKNPWRVPDKLNWIMDSGSFSELKLRGKYTYTPEEYLSKVEVWQPDYFVNMDYMCEPHQIKKTKLSVEEHQKKTLENQIKLQDLLDDSWVGNYTKLIAVIQGWEPNQYINHLDMLKEQGLITEYMGVGSICRRHAIKDILNVLYKVKKEIPRVKLHGFGVKLTILDYELAYRCLDSVDSMAWSFRGWKVLDNPIGEPLFGKPCPFHEWKKCTSRADDCAACPRYMNYWLDRNLKLISKRGGQTFLPDMLEPLEVIEK